MRARRAMASVAAATALGLGVATPAMASPVITGGLVNVTVTNVLNNNQVAVQIPISAAANICQVQVNAISTVTNAGGTYTCTARSGQQTLSITKA